MIFKNLFLVLFALGIFGMAAAQEKTALYKVNLAVKTFTAQGVDKNVALVLTDFMSAFLDETGQFKVMERSAMDDVLKEQGFQQSGACEEQTCVLEMGKLLGVSQIVSGTISKLGRTYFIQARLIDVQTGAILKFGKEQCVCTEDQLQEPVKKIAYALSNVKYPEPSASTAAAAEPKKSGSPMLLYIGLGGAVVAGGAVGAYMLLKNPAPMTTADKFGQPPAAPEF